MTYGSQANQGLVPIIQRAPANEVHFDDSQAARVVSTGASQRVDRQEKAMSTITREEFDARLETIETRMDGRVASLEAKMDTGFARLETSIHKSSAETIKWVIGTVIAMGAVGITVMTFVLNNAAPKAVSSPPAPIIIYAQPAPPPAITIK